MKAVNKVVRGLTAVELVACALTFAIMVICYFISVVNRNIIKGSMPWTEEMAVYSMVYMALLGTELGLRDGTQVSVTALTSKLEGKTIGKILDIIARLIVIYFVFMMFRNGNALVAKQLKTAQTTPVMKIPMYTLYLSLSISFCLTLITQVLMLIGKIFNIPMEPITNVDGLINTLFGKKKKEADNA
ncbi:MAG: TRAP transporter small permease [Oscillospiraceae bacterium]|nr:TRAP transporter small permease [Oscillospiraceae bacterium]